MTIDWQAKRDDWEAKQAERARAAAALAAQHPHLIASGPACNALVAAAKNIRTELGRAFRGVKFSVKSSRFSMGDSIDVSWTDGPTTKQVNAIIDKYSAGDFNGMDDSYSYRHNLWTDAFGDAKYVHSQRSYSDALLQTVLDRVRIHLGGIDTVPTVEDYRQGRIWQVKQSGGCDYAREVNIALSETTLFPTAIAIDGEAA